MNLNTNSWRTRKARAAAVVTPTLWRTLQIVILLFGLGGVAMLAIEDTRRFGYIWLGLAVLAAVLALWYRRDLSDLPPKSPAGSLDDMLEPGLLAALSKVKEISPRSAWAAGVSQWQGRFMINHLLLDSKQVSSLLSSQPTDMNTVWQAATALQFKENSPELDGAALIGGLILSSEPAKKYLATINLKEEEIGEACSWSQRLAKFISQPRPYFGGIGRDWAAGFTPVLDQFGQNISRFIEAGGGHFHTLAHADVLDGVVHNLSQGSGGVALVGPTGAGKTGLAYALAQRLLEGHDEALRYNQLISLNASSILSASGAELEKIILTLFGEASHAGNIIIFLDEASLFFGKGVGAFDMSQVLLPVMQNRSVKIVAAFTPNDWQALRASNESLAAQLAVINVNEPSPEVTMNILEDTALTLEARDGLLVTYQAVREAYRLSGQYSQELAYPGRAIDMLEQAIPYAENKILTAESVQSAVEKTKGVKVSKAEAVEVDVLLNLEDRIHQRMINQEPAVKVIAAALRRGRAGVANPNRPTGSFLFLGPTGVGKTELARSLAATYFGNVKQMIRLDMTEYQQAEDVSRLLEAGGDINKSLILSIRQQPFSVILLDEVEKAHLNILNLLLQLLDEGQLTDQTGKPASFKNAIIIATSNAGSADITQRVAAGDNLQNFERPLVDKLIADGLFKAELVNRFDEVVLFRPLNQEELTRIAMLMIEEVNRTLANQNVKVQLTEAALAEIVQTGYDPQFGARPMRRVIQNMVEDAVATRILGGQAEAGTVITLDAKDLAPNQ